MIKTFLALLVIVGALSAWGLLLGAKWLSDEMEKYR